MNTCNFAGRLGRDAEIREANGKPVANFSVAVDDFRNGEKGTLWISCSLWGDRATKLTPFLGKGQAVAVSGRVGVRQYTANDGSAKAELTLMVNDVTLLGSKPEGAAAGNGGHDWKAAEAKAKAAAPAPRQESPPADSNLDDAIPFGFAYWLPAGLVGLIVAASAAQGVIA